ncbi:helix-turn-helix domain-containing protein [Mammaliicoccus lentus]|uniref:helix-turn-helix domain-containing protein n=1 Tax=Mammaliicoccus lentus TaxID=42858 RepID=UPI0011C9716A|nr:helix-turn-helix transcriptional regulator [Mammaliicoccus lentus]
MSFSYDNLWKLAIDKKLSKTELRKKAGITPTTLAKLSKDQYVSMNVLDRLCECLNCEVSDIIQHKKNN